METFAFRLKRARLQKGADAGIEYRQTTLGDAIGVSGATISRYESGGFEPSLAIIQQLADALGVRAGWLAFAELPIVAPVRVPASEALEAGDRAAARESAEDRSAARRKAR